MGVADPRRLLLLLLAAMAHPAAGFKVLIDLNAFTAAELSRVAELPSGLDGVWEMTANTHPNATDGAWRTAVQTISAARIDPNAGTLPEMPAGGCREQSHRPQHCWFLSVLRVPPEASEWRCRGEGKREREGH